MKASALRLLEVSSRISEEALRRAFVWGTGLYRGLELILWNQVPWVHYCYLEEVASFSEPQFPHLGNGGVE